MTLQEKYGDIRLRWMSVTIDGMNPPSCTTVHGFLVDNYVSWYSEVDAVEPWLTKMLDGLIESGCADVDVPIGGGVSMVVARLWQ